MADFPSRAPAVSVAMITYNHERFITQAIESVLAQRTRFPIELVVGDDASTDGTARQIEALRARAPDVIRPIIRPTNVGMHRNVEGVLAECRGEFVAFLEGDDYWTADDKLQIQVDMLRACDNIVGVFHSAMFVDSCGRETGAIYTRKMKTETTTRDWLECNLAPTASIVVRRSALVRLPDAVQKLKMRDWPMWVFASLHGPWRFLPKVMAAYRVHEGGVSSTLSKAEAIAADVEAFEVFAAHLPPPFWDTARQWLTVRRLSALEDALDCGRYAEARRELRQIARLFRYCRMRNGRRLVSASWQALSPRSHRIAKGLLSVAHTRFGSGRNSAGI
jgi:glycosyltransferase involved in cell wall biosynthesis